MKTVNLIMVIAAIGVFRLSDAAEPSGTFTDARDGKRYKTAVIGGKRWMAENLNYEPKNGNSWCYENDNSFCGKYGRLYDWETAAKVCPAGWHLPSRREWDILGRAAGGERRPGDRYDAVDWYGAGKALKAKSGWIDPVGKSGNGSDVYGWAALPGGYYGYYDSSFTAAEVDGYWWTATESWNDRAHSRNMYYGNGYLSENGFHKNVGLSVRCLKDERKYTVTVLSASADAKGGGDYVSDETVTITAGTTQGKQFKKWTIANGDVTLADSFKSTTTFTMPANNVTVKANFDTIIVESGTFTDGRDGKTYKTVVIGGKRWMAENLNYKIPCESWCYNDTISYCDKYGRLYNWNTAKNICPAGWHLPTRLEWDYLEEVVGGRKVAGGRLKSKSGRPRNNYSKTHNNGTDDYGFSALPGGRMFLSDGCISYHDAEISSHIWTATDYNSGRDAYCAGIGEYSNNSIDWHSPGKDAGSSVRCVQDGIIAAEKNWEKEYEQRKSEDKKAAEQLLEKNTTYFVDSRDGKKYRAVKIGGTTWMAENLNYHTAKGSWCYGDDTSNCGKYGRLYDWETAKRVCPSGWYLPSLYQEWNSLVFIATRGDMCVTGGGWAGTRLRAKSGWRYNGGQYNSTDEFGFSALPGGYRNSYKSVDFDRFYGDRDEEADDSANAADAEAADDANIKSLNKGRRFEKVDSAGRWWTSTYTYKHGSAYAYYFEMWYKHFGINDYTSNMASGLSVRCVLGDGGGKRSDSARIAIGKERMKRERENRINERERMIMEAKKMEIEEQQLAKPRIEKMSTYFTDSRDGQMYRAVTIGGKRWMAQNLNYKPKSGNSWCYNDSVSYCGKYGRLYDWKTAKTVCPAMWRLSTDRDWDDLNKVACGGLGSEKLRTVSGWDWDDLNDKSGNGTDDFGFSILPGGSCDSKDSVICGGAGKWGGWWVMKNSVGGKPFHGHEGYSLSYHTNAVGGLYIKERAAYSVRCLQDTGGGKTIRNEPHKAK